MKFHGLLFLLPLLRLVSAWTDLSDTTLENLPRPDPNDFDIHSDGLLAPILIPRVPGTDGSKKVLRHFREFFSTQLPLWNVTTQNSTAKTPTSKGKEVPFVNFIATRDPPWVSRGDVGRLVLVAHYDSKLTPDGFIGATDSAVPCAVIMNAVKAVDGMLTKRWEGIMERGEELAAEDVGIMVLFLDGEEAFVRWSDEDSLYGARSLAEHWEKEFHPALSNRRNQLSSIDLFVLLDLLGASDPKIPSYFKTTHWAYSYMSSLETRMRQKDMFESNKKHPNNWFWETEDKDRNFNGWMVQDDHIPFLARGVEVLHVIPTPFPRVWHEMDDDGEHLDLETVRDWGLLLTGFVAGWLDLEGAWGQGKGKVRRGDGDVRTEL
ncbi:hypothetical protein RUND412_002323 [Rhizina undulata]